MTREEERIEQIEQFASQCYEDGEKYSAFISGAIWADNNPTQDVVNLNDVWHDASEVPQENEYVLIQDEENDYDVVMMQSADEWNTWCGTCKIIRWAYISDLLPKGGEK